MLDKNAALKRFMAIATGSQPADDKDKQAGAAMASIFGGVETISGNVIFMGDVSPADLEKVLRRRTDGRQAN